MLEIQNENATGQGGACVDRAGQPEATEVKTLSTSKSTIQSGILASKSTTTEAQRERLLALLRNGSKTTIELRQHGIMMPATRVFELKARGFSIWSERIPLHDNHGFRHSNVARYHLTETTGATTADAGVSRDVEVPC